MKLIVIGSNSNSHIRLNSQFVSGYHAELLLLDNGEILLTDKGSKNGTYINDQRLQPNKDIPIKRGDSVRFADQVLDWRNVPALPMPDFSKIKEMRGIGTNFRNKHQKEKIFENKEQQCKAPKRKRPPIWRECLHEISR